MRWIAASQQLQRAQEQEQPARTLQRGQLDAEVCQDQLAEQRKGHDYAERNERRPPSRAVAFRRCPSAGQAQENGYGSRRVDDDKQGDEDLSQELHAEERSWLPTAPQGSCSSPSSPDWCRVLQLILQP